LWHNSPIFNEVKGGQAWQHIMTRGILQKRPNHGSGILWFYKNQAAKQSLNF
jgi:hypothetical protein